MLFHIIHKEKKTLKNYNRREFIKIISGAIGGAMLTGCGSGGSAPSAYRSYRITNQGDVVGTPGNNMVIDSFRGTVHISSDGIITFDAVDADKRSGIFQLGVDLNGRLPAVAWERTALIKGETLSDGRVVAGFKAMDVNRAGSIAVDILPTTLSGQRVNHIGSGLYLDVAQQGFEPVMLYNRQLLDGAIYTTGVLGDIDLHEGNEMLVVGSYNAVDAEMLPGHGLFYLPGASVSAASMLMSSGDFVPSVNYSLGHLGLVDLHDNGHYVFQGNARPLVNSQANGTGTDTAGSMLMVTGNVATYETHLLGAAPELGAGDVIGETIYGPRMTASGIPYSVTWDAADEKMVLYHGDQVVIATGDTSPAGGSVSLLSTGSVGPGDEIYYTITSIYPSAQDLVVYDGGDHSTLLSRGDVLSDGGAPVEVIYFGATTKHVDDQNRIVLFCSFTDGSSALVVGLPV